MYRSFSHGNISSLSKVKPTDNTEKKVQNIKMFLMLVTLYIESMVGTSLSRMDSFSDMFCYVFLLHISRVQANLLTRGQTPSTAETPQSFVRA